MERFLSGKKILFISTKYFGYQDEMLKTLIKHGGEVEFYHDDPFDQFNIRILEHKVGKTIKEAAYNKFRAYVLKKTRGKKI